MRRGRGRNRRRGRSADPAGRALSSPCNFCEKRVLTPGSTLHICPSTDGAGRFARTVRVSLNRTPVTRFPPGRETCRLFDIVGLDEGTCGRRPRSAVTSGCRAIGKKPSRSSFPSEFASTVGQCPNTQHQILCIVQERLPEMPASTWLFHRVVVEHQLESLILAQNERWRHA